MTVNSFSRCCRAMCPLGLVAVFLVSVPLLFSCTQDVYDKGDSELSLVQADFVEAYVDSKSMVDHVITDEGERLQLTTPYKAKWVQRSDTTYRAVLYYNRLGQQAEPVGLSHVSTAKIRRPSEFKSGIKTDPLDLQSVWLSRNCRYLNLCVVLKTGAIEEGAELQTLGIVCDTVDTAEDGRRTYQLRLYHHQGDVPQYYSQRAYFSVPLHEVDVDSLQLTINTHEGPVTKSFGVVPK